MTGMNRLAVLLVPILLSGSLLRAQAGDPMQQGVEELRSGRYPAALALFNQAKQQRPGDGFPYFFAGIALAQSGQPLQAQSELEKAVELAPGQPQIALGCAEVQLKNGYLIKARETLATLNRPELLESLPADQLWAVSDLSFRAESPDEALAALLEYRKQRADDERIPFRMGQIHLAQNRLDEALDDFERALSETDRKAAANYGIGLVRFQQGELTKARAALEVAVRLEPDNPEYDLLLASVLLGLDQPAGAVELLARVEAAGTQLPKVYAAMLRAYGRLRQADKVQEYRRKMEALHADGPGSKDLVQKVANLLGEGQRALKSGNLGEAQTLFEQALSLDASNVLAHSYLAGIFVSRKNWALADEHLRALEATDGDAFETRYLRATYYYSRGELAEAREAALSARALQPGFPELRNLLGNIYYALGQYQQAADEYRTAMNLDPKRPEFKLNYETAAARLKGVEPR